MTSSRREFLLLGSFAGAALLVSCRGDRREIDVPPRRFGFWIAIDADGIVELRLSKLEMGQGIWTVLAVLTAEELAVEPSALRFVLPSTDDLRGVARFDDRAHPENVLEMGSSLGVTLSWLPVRTAAAAAREMLIAAAAQRWRVPAAECRARAGRVLHERSGRAAHYGELAAAASELPVPAAPALTPPAAFACVGRPTPRVEGRAIVTGTCRFSSDVRHPGQLYAALARAPLGASGPARCDEAAARAVRGVTAVVPLERAVAVVAENSWAALAGRDRLAATWSEGESARISSEDFLRGLERALDAPPGERYDPRARDVSAIAVARRGRVPAWDEMTLEARYATPFQAHAAMEPPNAVARWEAGGRCQVWAGTQWPQQTRHEIARRLGLGRDKIVIHPQRMGGSFGRKEHHDFVLEAAEVARALPGTPVQLLWSRADDIGHDRYHPPSRHRVAARVQDGRIVRWRHRLASPAAHKQGFRLGRRPELIPKFESAGAWNVPYAAADLLVEYVDAPCDFPLGFWRGIGIGSNVFAIESFVDELAHAARVDPLEFRLRNLAGEVSSPTGPPFPLSRVAATLELAADRSGWGAARAPGRGRGLAAVAFGGRSACATVADVVVADGGFRVERLVCAIDCGTAVNPLGLAGNVESALVWGLSALATEITFADGRAVQSSHLDYPILRLSEMPRVEVVVVPSVEPPSGAGEIPVPTVAPAVANAIFDACGRRPRSIPFRPEALA